MSTIIPEKEELKRAIKWLSAHREENPKLPLHTIIEQAVLRFDLSPADGEFLMKFLQKKEGYLEE